MAQSNAEPELHEIPKLVVFKQRPLSSCLVLEYLLEIILSVLNTAYAAASENHLIRGESACFISENVLYAS